MAWWNFGRGEEMKHRTPTPPSMVDARMIPVWKQGRPLPQPNDFKKFADEGYRLNSIIHSCISEIASSAAEPRLIIERRQGAEWVEVEDTGSEGESPGLSLHRLLQNPNREQSQFEFLEELVTYMMVMGNDFIHKLRSARLKTVELWHLRPDRIKIVPGTNGIVQSYRFGPNESQQKTIKAIDVTHIKARPDPIDDYWGLSPIVACARAADVDDQVLDYIRAFFQNAGTPAGILKLKTQVDPDERARIAAMWRERQTGENFHSLAVLDADADFQNVGTVPGQLKIDFIFDSSESRICSVFGVPPIIVGTRIGLIRSTFANYREARRSFWRETLAPLYERIADKLTHGIAEEFSHDLRISFDLSSIEELQESQDSKRAHALAAWDKGVMTLNEAREMIELENLGPEADILKRRTVDIFTPITELAVEEEPDSIIDDDPDKDDDEEEEKEEERIKLARFVDKGPPEPEWKAIHRVADAHHGRFMTAFLHNRDLIIGPEIEAAVAAGFSDGDFSAIERVLNWKGIEGPMSEAFRAAIASTMLAAGRAGEPFMPLGVELTFDITNPFATEFAREQSMNLVRQISDDTLQGLRHIMKQAYDDGLPPRESARRIMDVIGLTENQTISVETFRVKQLALGVSEDVAEKSTAKFARKVLKRRATVIARTETIRSASMGQQALWDQAVSGGLLSRDTKRVWIVTPDDRLDTVMCLPMADQTVGLEQPFVTGTGAEILTPPVHPQCRCAIALSIEK